MKLYVEIPQSDKNMVRFILNKVQRNPNSLGTNEGLQLCIFSTELTWLPNISNTSFHMLYIKTNYNEFFMPQNLLIWKKTFNSKDASKW